MFVQIVVMLLLKMPDSNVSSDTYTHLQIKVQEVSLPLPPPPWMVYIVWFVLVSLEEELLQPWNGMPLLPFLFPVLVPTFIGNRKQLHNIIIAWSRHLTGKRTPFSFYFQIILNKNNSLFSPPLPTF